MMKMTYLGTPTCTKCGIGKANHEEWRGSEKRNLCCVCYIDEGNPPSDWHSGCMATYAERTVKKIDVKKL